MSESVRILVLTDAHFSSACAEVPGHPSRQCGMGAELVRRAIEDSRRRGGFDCLVLLGDMVNDAAAPNVGDDLAAIRQEIEKSAAGVPLLAIPGNHDPRDRYMEAFGWRPRLDINEYRLIAFADRYEPGDICTRSEEDRRRLADLAAEAGGPIVALQHNPMNPAIESDYPYMLTNRQAVLDDYARAGVALSLSGHYHAGQTLNQAGGVSYLTAPALTEAPYRYAVVSLRGRKVKVEVRPLTVDGEGVVDCHAHTEFAYCGRGISAAAAVERSRRFGLAGICLTEHAPQLYCEADDFWEGRHIKDSRVWRDGGGRIEQFRQEILPMRDGFAWAGLEVELDADGQVTVRDEDRDWPDVLVGAIHFLPQEHKTLDDAQLSRAFMQVYEGLCRGGIDVLAHPWRYFQRASRRTPTELYGDLADLLAATGVAAEINLHINFNDVAFLGQCIARGVKIALGSDAHAPWEMAAFTAHLDILRQAAGRSDVADLLWRP